jgi:hypothetical protein
MATSIVSTAASTRSVAASAPRATHFAFAHKVFAAPGARFAAAANGDPMLYVTLGDLAVGISLPTLRAEFGIAADSPDGRLLDIVSQSLRFVREILPGDCIPRELLDGTASWSVEEQHLATARSRLTLQLATWMRGGETTVLDRTQLQRLADDPGTKERVQAAFGEAAERLGLGRDGRQAVVDRVELMARELSYIEALRDRVALVLSIDRKLNRLAAAYRRDRSFMEDLVRVRNLMRHPVTEFTDMLMQVDAQTSEILALLRNMDVHVAFIRETRNELHWRLMAWDEVVVPWQDHDPVRCEETERLVRSLYRLLAPLYATGAVWRRDV